MRCVDVELRKEGIRANAIVVKIVDTPRNRAENPDADHSRWTTGEELAEVVRVALHRRVGAPLGRADPGVWPRLSRAQPHPRRADRGGVAGGGGAPLRGSDLGRVDVCAPAAIAIVDGRIAAVGSPEDVARSHGGLERVDCHGAVAIPGLVDCHTHPAFGGDRAGSSTCAPRAPTTSASTRRAAGFDRRSTRPAASALPGWPRRDSQPRRLDGRQRDDDSRGQVGVRPGSRDRAREPRAVAGPHPVATIPTYLGAHSVPPEFGSADEYLDFAIAEVMWALGPVLILLLAATAWKIKLATLRTIVTRLLLPAILGGIIGLGVGASLPAPQWKMGEPWELTPAQVDDMVRREIIH